MQEKMVRQVVREQLVASVHQAQLAQPARLEYKELVAQLEVRVLQDFKERVGLPDLLALQVKLVRQARLVQLALPAQMDLLVLLGQQVPRE